MVERRLRAVLRSRPIVIGSALVAGLLGNYWMLEGALADRTNFDASWISDLSTRSESSGGEFVALGLIAALALLLYGVELVAIFREHGGALRRGSFAFLFGALATLVAAAAPLSCAEGLEAACTLDEDALDIVHSVATAGEIAGAILAFTLFAIGFLRAGRRRVGIATAAIGAVWLALTILTGVSYLSDAVDEIKGAFQRIDQMIFAAWLVVLACAATATVQEDDPVRR
jgi:hypothetical protein